MAMVGGQHMARYIINKEHNGIEIYFDKIPSESIRDEMKSKGWRWHRTKRCWYTYKSDANLKYAQSLCDDITPTISNLTEKINKVEEKVIYQPESIAKDKKETEKKEKSFANINDTCFISYEGKTYLGKILIILEESKKVYVQFYLDAKEEEYKCEFFSFDDIKKFKRAKKMDNPLYEGDTVKYIADNDGIEKGIIVRSRYQYYEKYYDIDYYSVAEDGKITRFRNFNVSQKRLLSITDSDKFFPIKLYETIQFEHELGTREGTVYKIWRDGTLEIGCYVFNDSYCEYINIDITDVIPIRRGRIALKRSDYINDINENDIKYNEQIIERIKNKDDFKDALAAQHKKLYKHQKAGTLLAEKYNKFAFFYDTGTGKTLMALDIIAHKQSYENAKFLIIAPKSIIKTAWMDDAAKFFPLMKILPFYGGFTDRKKKELYNKWTKNTYKNVSPYINLLQAIFGESTSKLKPDEKENIIKLADHYIVNAETFIRDPKYYIDGLGVSGVILDESAILKNYDSKTARIMREIAPKMKYFYLLSGKPAPNSIIEYFSQMKIVDPETFSFSYAQFVHTFCYGPQNKMITANETLFADMVSIRSLIMSKKDCLDLPETVDVVRYITLPEKVMEDYNELYSECMAIIKGMDQSTTFYSATSKLAVLMKLRQMASGFFIVNQGGYKYTQNIVEIHDEKINELNQVLDQIADEQVIIWAQFQHEIELIEKELQKRGTVVTEYGKTKTLEDNIDAFKNNRAQYIVANPKTLKYGVTFTNCHYVIYYSFSYSAEDYDQSHDRNYRLGQTKKCVYIYLQAEDTIDEIMYDRVKNKLSNAEFFEKLIKDASKHGIDYDNLKPKKLEDTKIFLEDEESAYKTILKDAERKNKEKILEEYVYGYNSPVKEYLDTLREPDEKDLETAKRFAFHKATIKKEMFEEEYKTLDIHEMEFSRDTIETLKLFKYSTFGDIVLAYESGFLKLLLNESQYEEVCLKITALNIIMLRNYIKDSRCLVLKPSDKDNVSVLDLNLMPISLEFLQSKSISKVLHLRRMTSEELFKECSLSEDEKNDIIYSMWRLNVSFFKEKVGIIPEAVKAGGIIKPQKELSYIKQEDVYDMAIEELDLSVRTFNVFKRAGVNTVLDLLQLDNSDLSKIRNFGNSSRAEAIKKIESDIGLVWISNTHDCSEDFKDYYLAKPKLKIAEISIANLRFPINIYNSLVLAGIKSVKDLLTISEEELLNKIIEVQTRDYIVKKFMEWGIMIPINKDTIKLLESLTTEEIIRIFTGKSELSLYDIKENKDKLINDIMNGTLVVNIEELDLSVRSYNCLKRSGIHTIQDVLGINKDDLYQIPNLSTKCIEEIIQSIKDKYDIDVYPKEELENDILIEDLNLSIRSFNCLKRAGIHTLQDILNQTEGDVYKIRNLGRKSAQEIHKKLNEELGIEWLPEVSFEPIY